MDDTINDFIEMLLKQNTIQPYAIFNNTKYGSEREDLLSTFLGFLQSRCIIRNAPSYRSSDVFVFSKPGLKIMQDETSRTVFVSEFKKFYGYN